MCAQLAVTSLSMRSSTHYYGGSPEFNKLMGELLHIHGMWILLQFSVGGRAASSLQMLQVFMGDQWIHGRCGQCEGAIGCSTLVEDKGSELR